MASAAHTPLPWFVVEPDANKPSRAMVCGKGVDIYNAPLTRETIANRDLIVRAVNCHAELLAAVHHLRVCRVCAEGDLKDCEGGMAALAVIRKAEGRDA